ncbi:MAG: hypothetical protein JNM84_12365 [Planctomycetes bacterium]|nr:hypothetical protein [Planctomycetota bacterium]
MSQTSAVPGMGPRDRVLALLIGSAALLVYAATPDAVGHGDEQVFLAALSMGDGGLGYHLGYLPLARILVELGLAADAALIWVSRASGALAVAAGYVVARLAGSARGEALLLAGALALTPSVWFCARSREVHALQLASALLALAVAMRARRATWKLPWLICAALLALVSHPVNALGLGLLVLVARVPSSVRRLTLLGALLLPLGMAFLALDTTGDALRQRLPMVGSSGGLLTGIGVWLGVCLEYQPAFALADLLEHAWLDWVSPQALWVPAAWLALLALPSASRAEALSWWIAAAPAYLILPALLRVREFGGYFALPMGLALLCVARLAVSTERPASRRALRAALAIFFGVQAFCGVRAIAHYERLGSDRALEDLVRPIASSSALPVVVVTCTQPRTNRLSRIPGLVPIDIRWTLDDALRADRESQITSITSTIEQLLGTGHRVICDGAIFETEAPTLELLPPLLEELERRFEKRELARAEGGVSLAELALRPRAPAPLGAGLGH